jgi:serine/threonine protein kinase
MTTFAEAVALIERATTFADLITPGAQSKATTTARGRDDAGRTYRRLVRIVHPDAAPAAEAATATAAFAKLAALWADRDGGLLTTPRGRYRLGPRVASGDVADLYALDGDAALLKVPRSPADNDLMDAEVRALTRLAEHGDPRHRAYAPRLVESFTHEDARGARRTAVVLERLHGFVTLADVARARPDGLDPRDAAWMWRRLLAGLGWAHQAGVVHGAVLPEHVLIHPAEHGLVLVDWCYAVPPGHPLTAVVPAHRDRYPPEAPAQRPVSPATDIYLATALIERLVGDRMPDPMRRFVAGCCYAAPRMRPQHAWPLLAELDDLLGHLYGPRRFRPFHL